MTARRHWPFAALLLAGCATTDPGSPATAPTELPTVTVSVAPLQTRAVQRSVTGAGTLTPYDDVSLAPKVGGPVWATYADLGDVVLPGMVLLEIDPTDYRKEVDRARRALDLELARLDLPALLVKEQFDAEKVPAVAKAHASWENAKLEYKRVSGVTGASDRELRAAETEMKVAEASKNVAVAEARAGLAAAWLKKDELDAAAQRLADCTLRAPVPTGWPAWAAAVGAAFTPLRYSVALKMVAEGDTVQTMSPTPAFRLVIDRALKLPVPVPEQYRSEVQVGLPVEVRVDAATGDGLKVRGIVYRISPTVDPVNRVFYPVIAVPNLDGRLSAGGFARATIFTRTDPAVKVVPPTAVVTFAGVNKVFVVENGKAKAVEVRLGTREKEWVEVIGPVPDGAQVITSGHSQVVDGSPIKLRE